ncbi:hypothetical protein [Serratia fonticola]|uniref:hypothetical protein n=1 Tax=Serratia fonticola TaxID=47917 RepID=UPI0008FEE5EE
MPDPIGLAEGHNLYAYVPNPLSAIDPLGFATCKVYRKTTPDDLARLEQGLGIKPKGISGSIAEHVNGFDTEHISVSLTKEAINRFRGGNGLI